MAIGGGARGIHTPAPEHDARLRPGAAQSKVSVSGGSAPRRAVRRRPGGLAILALSLLTVLLAGCERPHADLEAELVAQAREDGREVLRRQAPAEWRRPWTYFSAPTAAMAVVDRDSVLAATAPAYDARILWLGIRARPNYRRARPSSRPTTFAGWERVDCERGRLGVFLDQALAVAPGSDEEPSMWWPMRPHEAEFFCAGRTLPVQDFSYASTRDSSIETPLSFVLDSAATVSLRLYLARVLPAVDSVLAEHGARLEPLVDGEPSSDCFDPVRVYRAERQAGEAEVRCSVSVRRDGESDSQDLDLELVRTGADSPWRPLVENGALGRSLDEPSNAQLDLPPVMQVGIIRVLGEPLERQAWFETSTVGTRAWDRAAAAGW